MALVIAGVCFLAYVGNVLLGALADSAILSDVSEMVILFIASIFFVAAILRREADAKNTSDNS